MAELQWCPACKEKALGEGEPGTFTCSACGAAFIQSGKKCPGCGLFNVLEADECSHCGEPISISSQVILRQSSLDEPYVLQKARAQASAIKQREQKASESRMQVFQEIDRRRMETEAMAIAEQSARDTRIFKALMILFGLFLLGLLIVSALLIMGGP